MKLDELQVYQLSMELGEKIWKIVMKWDYFAKDTVGKQLVRAVDSIAANLSEGYGRYHYKESRHFGYYSRGSLFETKTWITKAHNRGMTNDVDFGEIIKSVDIIGVKINNYINSIGRGSNNKVSENESSYLSEINSNDNETNDD